MSSLAESDRLLVDRVRSGQDDAWRELIARFEGRLLAFVEARIGNRAASEDVVQETFLGFLTSLPNYDQSRSLESYLFSIAAHKLTDHLRREGRRPTLPLAAPTSSGSWQPPARLRGASTMLRSAERRDLEEHTLVAALEDQIARLRQRGDWNKLACLELVFVRGWGNKEAAGQLDLSEQSVANFKFEFLERLRTLVRKQQPSADVFPELYEPS
jgi:RNA polymerase sigma-70 factor (ECF subfamily)